MPRIGVSVLVVNFAATQATVAEEIGSLVMGAVDAEYKELRIKQIVKSAESLTLRAKRENSMLEQIKTLRDDVLSEANFIASLPGYRHYIDKLDLDIRSVLLTNQ